VAEHALLLNIYGIIEGMFPVLKTLAGNRSFFVYCSLKTRLAGV